MAGSTISDYDRANMGKIVAGHGDWFSARLLRLIVKSDAVNLEILRSVYPKHVQAYEEWKERSEE